MNRHARALARVLSLVCATVTASGATAASWNSKLFPRPSGALVHTPTTVSFGGRSWRLPDYSYAGYRLGTQPLATGVPCASRTVAAVAGSDIATALQSAINAIGSAGGGTVLIPAGRFTLSRSIAVPYSNVSIVGAGSLRTLLDVPSSYRATDDLYEGVFTLGKAIGQDTRRWSDRGDVLGSVTYPIREGDVSVLMANAASVVVGQWIVIQQYFWPDLVVKNDSSATWPSYRYTVFPPAGTPDRGSSFSYLRQVTAKSGNRVSLDAPIPFALDPANNAIGVRSAERQATVSIVPRSNLGVAGLGLIFADNDNGLNALPSGRGVYFEGVRDGWVYDVHIRNFPVAGVVVESSARVTVLDSAVYRAQEHRTGAYGYGFTVDDSQNVLVRSNYAELSRHNFLNRGALDSMVVYSRNISAAARVNGDDQHYRTAHGMLWDRHDMRNGTSLTLGYRGSDSSQAQESNLSSVVWNAADDGYRGGTSGGFISMNPSSSGQSIVVGGTGRYPVIDDTSEAGKGQQMSAALGLQIGSLLQAPAPGSRDKNVLYESLRTPGLVPESLYEGLLMRRIGIARPDFASLCRAPLIAAAAVPSRYTGAGKLVYDDDHLGFTPILGSGCSSRCRVDAVGRNYTPGGRYSMLMQMRTTDGASIGVNLRGPEQKLEQFTTVTVKVFPTVANLKLIVRATHEPHQATMKAYPAYTSATLAAGQWTSVKVPVASAFGTGTFNALRLTGSGSGATGIFYVDDVVLN